MKSCFGYIRVSTQKQGEGVSLEAQRDAITAFAREHNLAVCQWFEEKETAAKRGRPVFNQMLRQLKQGRAGGLIMHKIDRSARNLRDWALVSELPSQGIDIYFATESLDFRSRGGRLAANLQAVIAEDYIHNLREETIKGLRGRLKQGLYPFRAPIGYLDQGRGVAKTLCPAKAPLVRRVFSLYASGQHSIASLTAEMKRQGLTGHSGRPVTERGIETILNNPFYCGLIEIKRTGESYHGRHEPIIDVRSFQRVQEVKSGKAGKKLTRHNHRYRGLFRCGLCDSAMIPERQKGRVYYRCHRPGCAVTTIREDRLEAEIQTAFEHLTLTEDSAASLGAAWQRYLVTKPLSDERRSLELRIERTRERLQRLTDLLIDGVISKDEHCERNGALKLELMQLEADHREIAHRQPSEAQVAGFLELMKNLAGLHIAAKPAEKRVLVQNCFSNRTVFENGPCLEPHSWLTSRDFSELSPLVTQSKVFVELCRLLPSRDL